MLDDLIAFKLRVVVCGFAAGAASAIERRYYADPRNKFWRAVAEVGLTPRQLSPAEYRELLKFGIGLTDLVKGQAGTDAEVRFEKSHREDLRALVMEYKPPWLCFNGKTAAKKFLGVSRLDYGIQSERIGCTGIFVAPSTSGAAGRYWDIARWRELARHASALAPLPNACGG